jgi:hypothetical protein
MAGAAPAPAPPGRGRALRRGGAILLAALLLVWPAAWNGYPLVFADTGTYLGQALLLYVGWDRPPCYSLFLLATHWRLTLWGPVLAQGLILAHLLSLVLRVQGLGGNGVLLGAAAGLAALTGLPFFAGQLMPDLLAGVVVLALWLLGFRATALSRAERVWLLLLAAFAVASHQSHLPLAFGLALVAGAMLWLGQGWRAVPRPAGRMLVPSVLALLAVVAVNLLVHHRLAVSPFGSVFVATRLIYDGPGLAHIRRACAADPATYRICPAIGRGLPGWHNAFLWAPDSPLHDELGGAKAWAPEAGRIIAGTLREAPGAVAASAAGNLLAQLTRMRTGDGLEAWPGQPGPEPLIARFFPGELTQFQDSLQRRGLMRPRVETWLAPLHVAAAAAGAAALVLLLGLRAASLLRGRGRPGGAGALAGPALGVMVLAAALGNAAITGALSVPADRYQARLAWLYLLAPGLLLAAAPARGVALSPSAGPAPARGAARAA